MPSGKYTHKKIPVEIRFKRFWDKMEKPLEGCWIWPGTKDVKGYGKVFIEHKDGRTFINYAHRVAYSIFTGAVSPSIEVCHHCDNPPCVRPDHLFLGTHLDNMLDGKRKNRFAVCGQNSPKGDASPNSKLSNERAREMRRFYSATNITMDQLARKYKISTSLVHAVIRNKRWIEAGGDATKVRICRKIPKEIHETIRHRYQAGERTKVLAQEYGVTTNRILQISKHNS